MRGKGYEGAEGTTKLALWSGVSPEGRIGKFPKKKGKVEIS